MKIFLLEGFFGLAFKDYNNWSFMWRILNKLKETGVNQQRNCQKIIKNFKLDKDALMIQLIGDKIADEDCANKALKVAERKIAFFKSYTIMD